MLSCIWFYIVCLCVGYFTDTPFGFIMQVIACATVVLFSTALRKNLALLSTPYILSGTALLITSFLVHRNVILIRYIACISIIIGVALFLAGRLRLFFNNKDTQ